MGGRQGVGRSRALAGEHGDPEVRQGRFPETGHEDIRGLDVAVDDSLAGGQFEYAADLHADADHVLDRQYPLGGQAIRERSTRAILHLHVAPAVGKEPTGEHGDHVGVAGQAAGHRQLSSKAAPVTLVDHRHGQDLDRDQSIKLLLASAIHHARSSRADRHGIGATDRAQGIDRPVAPPSRHGVIMPQP